MKSQKSPEISYYMEYSDKKAVVFGYYYKDFFHMINDLDNKINNIKSFCVRNNKTISYKFFIEDKNSWELQIKVEQNV